MSESLASKSRRRKERKRRLNQKQPVSDRNGIEEEEQEEVSDENNNLTDGEEVDTNTDDDDGSWYFQWGLQMAETVSNKVLQDKLAKNKPKKKDSARNKTMEPDNNFERRTRGKGMSAQEFTHPRSAGSSSLCSGDRAADSKSNVSETSWHDMAGVTNVLQNLKCSSTPNLSATTSTDSRQKLTKLVPRKTYRGVVESSHRKHFVVLVANSVKVLVFTARFQPRGSDTTLGPEVPASSLVKTGDSVLLTAIPKETSRSELKWVAQKCWQEDAPGPAEKPTRPVGGEPVRAALVEVSPKEVKFIDGVRALANDMYLFGFSLAHAKVDLTDIFERGHLMWYVPSSDRPGWADVAWFESLPSGSESQVSLQQQYQVFKFMQGRVSQRSSPAQVMSVLCGLNKKAANIGAGIEALYGDVLGSQDPLPRVKEPLDGPVPHGRVPVGPPVAVATTPAGRSGADGSQPRSTSHVPRGRVSVPEATDGRPESRVAAATNPAGRTGADGSQSRSTSHVPRGRVSVLEATDGRPEPRVAVATSPAGRAGADGSSPRSTCQVRQACSPSSVAVREASVLTVNASTQTYATGDIMCCYSFDIDDSSDSD